MKCIRKLIFAVLTCAALLTLYSCRTVPEQKLELSRKIADKGQLNAKQSADEGGEVETTNEDFAF